jgi:PhnB protein
MAAGAKEVVLVQDIFWRARIGTLEDLFGHRWSVSTHIEDLSSKETNFSSNA